MGTYKTRFIILAPLLACCLSACDEMEPRGFIAAYETADQRFEQSVAWNNIHAARDVSVTAEEYVIYAMGDSHVGETVNLDAFFDDALEENAAAAVMAGDLTTGHEADFHTFAAHMPPAESLRTFPLVGNHDLYFGGWQHFYAIFGASTYTFEIHTAAASDLCICLDSGGGTLGSRQMGWLKNILEDSRDQYRHCIIFTHNNLFRFRPTGTTNPLVEEIRVLVDLFVRYHVDMVVTAHDHKRNTGILGHTTHIIMDALADDCDNAGYLKIYVDASQIRYKFVSL
jgi:hypothetical protein